MNIAGPLALLYILGLIWIVSSTIGLGSEQRRVDNLGRHQLCLANRSC